MSRCLLAKTRLSAFVEWCSANNIETREGRGAYQVIQVKLGNQWHAIYERSQTHAGNAIVHLTVPTQLEHIVKCFVRGAQLLEYQQNISHWIANSKEGFVDLSKVSTETWSGKTKIEELEEQKQCEGEKHQIDPNFVDDGIPPWE